MKRTFCVVGCAALVLAVMSGAVLAAQIAYIGPDTATGLNWQGLYGHDGACYWNIVNGKPDYTAGPTSTNPAYVSSFTYQNTTGGSGGSGGGSAFTGNGSGGGGTGINYNLVLNESKTFQFTAFFYDATYGGDNGLQSNATALEVRLIDPAAGTDESAHAITVGQLEAGIYEQWTVTALAGDTITTEVVWAAGAGVGAAGFFLDNVTDATPPVPEPATVGLVLFGLGGLFLRRHAKN